MPSFFYSALWQGAMGAGLATALLLSSLPGRAQELGAGLIGAELESLTAFVAEGQNAVVFDAVRDVLAGLNGAETLLSFKSREKALAALAPDRNTQLADLLDLSLAQNRPFEEIIREATEGIDIAVTYSYLSGAPIETVEVMTPAQMALFSTETYRLRALKSAGYGYDDGGEVSILPVALNGRPTLHYGTDPETLKKTVGQDVRLVALEPESSVRAKSVGPNAQIVDENLLTFRDTLPTPALDLKPIDEDDTNAAGTTTTAALPEAAENTSTPRCTTASDGECYLSAVSLHNNGTPACSGVLVGPVWVLTAAHCACAGAPAMASLGNVTPNRDGEAIMTLRASGIQINQRTESATVPVTSERYFFGETPGGEGTNAFCKNRRAWKSLPVPSRLDIQHAELGTPSATAQARAWIKARADTYAQSDLVLLRLRRPLEIFDHTPLSALGDDRAFDTNVGLSIVGFGTNNWEVKGGHKTELRADMTSERCTANALGAQGACIPGKEMVMHDKERGNDSCNGDSGAPVFAHLKGADPVIIAIVSRGMEAEGCGGGGINVIVATDDVRNWVSSVIATL